MIQVLATTKLPIETLSIFASTPYCNLPCDYTTKILSTVHIPHLAKTLSELKKLHLRLLPHIRETNFQSPKSLEFGRKQTAAICQFLHLCPNLKELRLHWCKPKLVRESNNALDEEKLFFDRVGESCQFPSLEVLTLEGITTTEAALLTSLRNSPRLRRFVLENITLTDGGRFRSVFDHLFEYRRDAELNFNTFFEDRMIEFDGLGKAHYARSGTPWHLSKPNYIVRTGQEWSRNAIVYRPIDTGYAFGSAACHNYVNRRRLKYGPWF